MYKSGEVVKHPMRSRLLDYIFEKKIIICPGRSIDKEVLSLTGEDKDTEVGLKMSDVTGSVSLY